MREYGFSALTSVITERSASSSRMVRIAFIPAVPPPMIRCRRAIIQSFSALLEFRSSPRSARSPADPRLAPRPDAPRLALPSPFQRSSSFGHFTARLVRRTILASHRGPTRLGSHYPALFSARLVARRASARTTHPFSAPASSPAPPRLPLPYPHPQPLRALRRH